MNFYIFNNGIMTENAMSGCDQRVLNWSLLFLKQANSVAVITSKQGKKRFDNDKIKVFETTGKNFKGLFGLFFSYVIRAVKGCYISKSISLDNSQKNIIYSASDLLADFIPALSLKLKNKQALLMVGVHLLAPLPWKGFKKYYLKGLSFPTLSGIYYSITQWMFLFLAKRNASLILVSNYVDKERLFKKGFSDDKILVTYGAVDNQVIAKVSTDQKIYDACYVGRFHAQKGFTDLIDVWKNVSAKFENAKLAVVGYDINLEKMKQKVKQAGLENNIIFMGFLGGVEKYKLIKQSKIALVPSYYESFGMVILEAMACGVPAVLYDLPVYKDIYTKGILKAGIGDKKDFTEKVISLLNDEQLRDNLSLEAKELSENFSWEKTAQDILHCLEGN